MPKTRIDLTAALEERFGVGKINSEQGVDALIAMLEEIEKKHGNVPLFVEE